MTCQNSTACSWAHPVPSQEEEQCTACAAWCCWIRLAGRPTLSSKVLESKGALSDASPNLCAKADGGCDTAFSCVMKRRALCTICEEADSTACRPSGETLVVWWDIDASACMLMTVKYRHTVSVRANASSLLPGAQAYQQKPLSCTVPVQA